MRTLIFSLFTLVANMLAATDSIYDITVQSPDGQVPLSAFKGRVMLIVNTASKDRNATQMASLETLYQKYSENGFVVLAFPSDDFMNEEPAQDKDIRQIYHDKFNITFPVFNKVRVTGAEISPLYAFLTNPTTDPNYGWEIDWSFTKFLVDRNGKVVNRFGTTVDPASPKVVEAIERLL